MSASPSTVQVSQPIHLQTETSGSDASEAIYEWQLIDSNGNIVYDQGDSFDSTDIDTSALNEGTYTVVAIGTAVDYDTMDQVTEQVQTQVQIVADRVTGLSADNANPTYGDVITLTPTYNFPQLAPNDSISWQSQQLNVPSAQWQDLSNLYPVPNSNAVRWPATLPAGTTYDIRETLVSAGVTTTSDTIVAIDYLPRNVTTVTYVDFYKGSGNQPWMTGTITVVYPNSGISKWDPGDGSVTGASLTISLQAANNTVANQISDISNFSLSLIEKSGNQWNNLAAGVSFVASDPADPLNSVYTATIGGIYITGNDNFEIDVDQGANSDIWGSSTYPNLPTPQNGTLWKISGTITAPSVQTNDYYPGSFKYTNTSVSITTDQATGIGDANAHIPIRSGGN